MSEPPGVAAMAVSVGLELRPCDVEMLALLLGIPAAEIEEHCG